MTGTSEHDIAIAVMRVAKRQAHGLATFKRLYAEIPDEIKLTNADLAPSTTRNGEPMWRQIVRNIKSHDGIEGNAIYEGWLEHAPRVGYKVTKKGAKQITP